MSSSEEEDWSTSSEGSTDEEEQPRVQPQPFASANPRPFVFALPQNNSSKNPFEGSTSSATAPKFSFKLPTATTASAPVTAVQHADPSPAPLGVVAQAPKPPLTGDAVPWKDTGSLEQNMQEELARLKRTLDSHAVEEDENFLKREEERQAKYLARAQDKINRRQREKRDRNLEEQRKQAEEVFRAHESKANTTTAVASSGFPAVAGKRFEGFNFGFGGDSSSTSSAAATASAVTAPVFCFSNTILVPTRSCKSVTYWKEQMSVFEISELIHGNVNKHAEQKKESDLISVTSSSRLKIFAPLLWSVLSLLRRCTFCDDHCPRFIDQFLNRVDSPLLICSDCFEGSGVFLPFYHFGTRDANYDSLTLRRFEEWTGSVVVTVGKLKRIAARRNVIRRILLLRGEARHEESDPDDLNLEEHITDAVARFVRLPLAPNVGEIVFPGRFLDDAEIVPLYRALKSATSLNVLEQDVGTEVVCEAISIMGSRLLDVCLAANAVDDRVIDALIEHSPNVRSIILGATKITHKKITEYLEHQGAKLTQFWDSGFRVLHSAAARKCSDLVDLCTTGPISKDIVTLLARSARTLRSFAWQVWPSQNAEDRSDCVLELEKLQLTRMQSISLSGVDIEVMASVLRCVASSVRKVKLSFSTNQPTLAPVLSVLKTCKHLSSLNFQNSLQTGALAIDLKQQNEELVPFVRSLPFPKRLRYFMLGEEIISTAVLEAIAELCPNIETFSVSGEKQVRTLLSVPSFGQRATWVSVQKRCSAEVMTALVQRCPLLNMLRATESDFSVETHQSLKKRGLLYYAPGPVIGRGTTGEGEK